MAGKRLRSSASGRAESRTRKKTISRDTLCKAAATLESQAGELLALAEQLKQTRLKEVEIDGHGLLGRGVENVDRFIGNVSRSVGQVVRSEKRSSM